MFLVERLVQELHGNKLQMKCVIYIIVLKPLLDTNSTYTCYLFCHTHM